MTTLDVAHPLHEQQQSFQLLLQLEDAGMIDRVSLTLPADTSIDEAIGVAGFLGEVKRRGSWYIGDEMNQSEAMHGEEYSQVLGAFGLNEETLRHYKFVALNVPKEMREPTVPFGAHAAVARLNPKEQRAWLKQAARKGWGEAELRAAMRAKRTEDRPQLPGTEEGEEGTHLDVAAVVEVARAILRDAHEHPDDASLMTVPRDDIARLHAALAGE